MNWFSVVVIIILVLILIGYTAEKHPWWAKVMAWVVFSAVMYNWYDRAINNWKISHFEQLSPAEQQRIADQANRELQVEAEKRCEGVSDRLMDTCIAAMKEKIESEDRARYYQEQDEPQTRDEP